MISNASRDIRRFLSLACILILLPAQFAWAGVEPQPFRTGLFTVARGQGVRVSVLNGGNARGIINPCMRIWDAAGLLLAEADAGPLRGGRGISANFLPVPDDGAPPPGGTPVPEDGRVLVRVEVEISPVPDDGLPTPEDGQPVPEDGRLARRRAALRKLMRDVIPTVEVFDLATGRTEYTLPFAKVAFGPGKAQR